MHEKINYARCYVAKTIAYFAQCGCDKMPDLDELINDAANLFADTYDEYMAIWAALQMK